MPNEVFLGQQNGPRVFYAGSFERTMTKGTAYALRERALSEAGALDKCRWEPGTGLTPDKKEANGDRGTGSDAPPRRSPRLMEDLNCNRAASQGNSSPANSSARVKA